MTLPDMPRKRIAYFNYKGEVVHLKALLKAGYDISSLYYADELEFINTTDPFATLLDSAVVGSVEECDIVVIAGTFPAISKLAQYLNRPVSDVNLLPDSPRGDDEVNRLLKDMDGRLNRKGTYLSRYDALEEIIRLMHLDDNRGIISFTKDYLYYEPFHHEAIYHQGLSKVFCGEIAQGIRLLHHRSHLPKYYPKNSFAEETKVWNGIPTDEMVLIWSTPGPGLGSEFLNYSFLAETAKRQKKLVVTCDGRIVDTFRRNFPEVLFFAHDSIPEDIKAQIKYHAYAVSLARYYFIFTGETKFPNVFPYLKPDENIRQKFVAKYSNLKKTKIGISWYTPNPKTTAKKTLPDEAVLELAKLKDTSLLSLQHKGETLGLWQNEAIIFDSDFTPIDDVESLIHQISAMDYVITIDNSVAYIARALGVKTYLPTLQPPHWPWLISQYEQGYKDSVEVIRKSEDESCQDMTRKLVERLNATSLDPGDFS